MGKNPRISLLLLLFGCHPVGICCCRCTRPCRYSSSSAQPKKCHPERCAKRESKDLRLSLQLHLPLSRSSLMLQVCNSREAQCDPEKEKNHRHASRRPTTSTRTLVCSPLSNPPKSRPRRVIPHRIRHLVSHPHPSCEIPHAAKETTEHPHNDHPSVSQATSPSSSASPPQPASAHS